MPTYHITAPDGSEYEVTGPGSEQEALAQIQAQHQPAAAPASPPTSEGSGVVANYFGGPLEPVAKLGSSMLAGPVSGIAGLGAMGLNAMGAKLDPAGIVEKVGSAMTYEPRTDAGKASSAMIDAPFRKLQQVADRAGDPIASAGDPNRPLQMRIPGRGPVTAKEYGDTGSPAMATAVNVGIQALPSIFLKGRGKTVGVAEDVSRAPPLDPRVAAGETAAEAPVQAGRDAGLGKPPPAPTKEALLKDSRAAYKRAESSGAVITTESFEKAKGVIRTSLEKEGIDPTLHPSATAALKRITETEGPVTLEKLETLRRIAKDAEASVAPADRRLAGIAVDTLDRYAETLSARDLSAGSPEAVGALKEARNLWSRARKADTLDELMSRAELSAPNFSASGMENAIRTEFRNLAKNSRKMRTFTAEERAAIKKVAMGGPVENSLRMLGKFAPTGVVSTALSTGAGFMIGGPAGMGLLPAAGGAARYGASRMTMRNATRANELVRRGPNALAKKATRNALATEPVP